MLAALVEACLGALYLEHGFEPIRAPIVDAFQERIEYALEGHVDYKTELQEELARRGLAVTYTVVDGRGPAARPQLHLRGRHRRRARRHGAGRLEEGGRAGAAREALEKLASADA